MPMVNSVSIRGHRPGERNLSVLVQFALLGPDEEHVALLVNSAVKFDRLRRKDDLFDDGVAAIFGLACGEAELLALSLHAGRFTSARAAAWLAERGFKPLLFVPNSGRLAAADFDAPRAAPVGRAVSGNSTKGERRW